MERNVMYYLLYTSRRLQLSESDDGLNFAKVGYHVGRLGRFGWVSLSRAR